ncbi:MAG: glycine betaine ABC transporter substrate-binding protein [Dehalobacterium sp.]
MKNKVVLVIICTITLLIFSGCLFINSKTVRIGVVDWPEDRCMTGLVKIILEQEMDYHVELVMLDIDSVFNALAEGKCDFFLDGWLPITHEKFIYKYGSEIENLGINYAGARTGLVVPSYVPVYSIAQLNENKNKFNNTIIGIEPDAGIIKSTQNAIKEYDLDYQLVTSSSSEMVEKLKAAIDNKEWIVVTGWSPHWKFAKWDLKFLDDPHFIYGAEENLHTITRKGFAKDYPKISDFLYNFTLDKQQLAELLLIDNNFLENTEEAFVKWINEHRELVNEWLEIT